MEMMKQKIHNQQKNALRDGRARGCSSGVFKNLGIGRQYSIFSQPHGSCVSQMKKKSGPFRRAVVGAPLLSAQLTSARV